MRRITPAFWLVVAGMLASASAVSADRSTDRPSRPTDSTGQVTAGSGDTRPSAIDDKSIFIIGLDLSAVITVLANDTPGVAPVKVTIASPPSHGNAMVLTEPASAVNIIEYRPTQPVSEGVDTFTYLITDAKNHTATGTVVVNLTDPVTCANDASWSARNTPTTVDVLANDAGFDIPPVVVSIPGPPAQGTAVVNPDRTVTFTPPTGVKGFFTFNYRVGDGSNEPVECSVTINVEGTVAVDDQASVEDFVTRDIAVLTNDRRDVLVAPVTIEITGIPRHGKAFVLPAAGNTPATIRYTSNPGFVGQDTLRYRLRDSAAKVSNQATVTITASESRPVAASDTVNVEDGEETAINAFANDAPGNDLPPTFTITAAPAHGSATVVTEGGGTNPYISYKPAAGYTGADTLSYTITDSDGDVSQAVPVAITVRDTAPVAVDDTVNGDARTGSTLDVVANDGGLVDLPIALVITRAPSFGIASVIPAAVTRTARPAIGYASNRGAGATDTLHYTISDADGGVSNEATVTINLTNAAPVAVDDAVALEDATTLGIAVLDNDSGINNRPLTLTITRQPAHGKAAIATGKAPAAPVVDYMPGAGFVGSDSFRYRVTDGDGEASKEATVTITVSDSAPAAANDAASGDSRDLTAVDVLANDTGLTDGPVTVDITGQPANGTATLVTISTGTGTRPGIAYASNKGFSGSDVVRYRVKDSDGDVSNEAALTFTVSNPAPVAVSDIAGLTDRLLPVGQSYVTERIRTPFDVLRNDTGRGNRPNAITITRAPLHGTAEIDSATTTGIGRPGVSYASTPGYTGPDSFRYTVTDGDGQVSNEATVTFEVADILTAIPDGSPFPVATPEGKAVTVNVLGNDGGLARGPIKVEVVGAANGSARVNPDNTVTFQPDAGFTGRFPSPACPPETCFSTEGGGFRYRITDGMNQRAEAAVFVDVVAQPGTGQQ